MPRKRKTELRPMRSVAAKDRWRCAVCQEWKYTAEYTENQLDIVKKDVNLQPSNCFMTCKDCADEPEMHQCEGHCGKMKPVTDFSKVSRKDQTWKCMECVSWDGLQEAYVPPLERKHLETMKLGVSAATAMAENYMDEPGGHPEDSNWDLALARAAKKAGLPVPEKPKPSPSHRPYPKTESELRARHQRLLKILERSGDGAGELPEGSQTEAPKGL